MTPILAASTQATVGAVILFLALIIAVVYAAINIRQGTPEVGSEIELAANRKPYYSDEELEGRKLDRALTWGLFGLFVCAVGVPLYWLAEPGRQEGAAETLKSTFVARGEEMFAPTADGGFNCAFCHGTEGVGGAAPYTITDADGRFVKQVEWKGPALNTVLLRYSREEVRYILTYGRPFSPMPPWGLEGGGPLNDQQLQNLIDYMESIQLTPEEAQAEVAEQLERMMERKDEACVQEAVAAAKVGLSKEELAEFSEDEVDVSDCPPMWASEGEALFNMGYDDGFAGGAYSCGRCHTQGWSYGEKEADGGGALGPSLRGDAPESQFPGAVLGVDAQTDFVCEGSEDGALYGVHGQGSGKMPGFCSSPAESGDPATGEVGVEAKEPGAGMMTREQVRAIVEYERSL
jgi:mono/diheme cytochrome c family protein